MNRQVAKAGGLIARTGNVGVVTLVLVLAACSSGADLASTTFTTSATSTSEGIVTTPVESTMAPPASTEPAEQAAGFPIATFAAISEDPVTEELAAEL